MVRPEEKEERMLGFSNALDVFLPLAIVCLMAVGVVLIHYGLSEDDE